MQQHNENPESTYLQGVNNFTDWTEGELAGK